MINIHVPSYYTRMSIENRRTVKLKNLQIYPAIHLNIMRSINFLCLAILVHYQGVHRIVQYDFNELWIIIGAIELSR